MRKETERRGKWEVEVDGKGREARGADVRRRMD
jgi:hypothetical protein